MSLVPHKIVALNENNEGAKNTIAGAVVSLFDSSGAAVTLFDDEAGSNGSTTKQTDSQGAVVVWVTAGEYDEQVNGGVQRRVSVGGNSVISYPDTASLQTSRPTKTGQRAENRERANAPYALAPSGYVAQPGDLIAANGRVWELQIDGIAKGAWFSSFSDAVDRGVDLDYTGETLNITLANTTFKTVSGINIKGGVFNFTAPDTAYKRVFTLSDVVFDGSEFNFSVVSGGQVSLCLVNGDNVTFEKCKIDGGVFDDGGSASHLAYVIQPAGTGSQDNVNLINCDIKNVSFVHLKSNSETSTQTNWSVERCTFNGIFREGVGLNSPSGAVSGFKVINNKFITHLAKSTGSYGLYIACATGSDITIDGNEFYGECDQCIHVEENAVRPVITNNTGFVDCEQAIALLENNVGGVLEFPHDAIIKNNTFTKSANLKNVNSAGIILTNNVSSDSPSDNSVIEGNYMSGFETGYKLDSADSESNICQFNVAEDCAIGVRSVRFFGVVKGNTSKKCDTGVRSVETINNFDGHTFEDCTVNADGLYVLINPTFRFGVVSLTGGVSDNFPILTLSGIRVNANVATQANGNTSTNSSIKHSSVTYDGTTFSSTSLNALEGGNMQTFISDDGTNMNLRIFSGVARDTKPYVKFNGFISHK